MWNMKEKNVGGEPAHPPINFLNNDIFDKYIRFIAFLIKSTVSHLFDVDMYLVKVNFMSKIDNLIAAWIKYIKSPFDSSNRFDFVPNMDSVYRLTLVSFILKLIRIRPNPFDSILISLLNCSVNELASILYALISRELNNDELKSVIKNSIKFRVYSPYSKLLNDKVSIALFSSIKNQYKIDVDDSVYDCDKCLTRDVVNIQLDINNKIAEIKSVHSDDDDLQNRIDKCIDSIYNYYGVKSTYFYEIGASGRAEFCSSKIDRLTQVNDRLNKIDHILNLKVLLDRSAENISSQIISRFESVDYKSILNKYSSLINYLELNDISINYGMIRSMIINNGIYIPSPLIDLEFPFDPSRLSDYIKFVPYDKSSENPSNNFIKIIKGLNEDDCHEFRKFLNKFFISRAHLVVHMPKRTISTVYSDLKYVGVYRIGVKL